MKLYSNSATTHITDGILKKQMIANQKYLMELDEELLLFNYRFEAGLDSQSNSERKLHGGWESPTCQLRGHFLGYWMSAAARLWRMTKDNRVRAKLEYIVEELAKCQKRNGGEWCFSIPEKYIFRLYDGIGVWAPQCTVHKTLMGLIDAYEYADIPLALEIAEKAAGWFLRFTATVPRERMDYVMENSETGGIMEAWADLYRLTGKEEYLELMVRFERPEYYAKLLAGEDVLTNQHANSTIPEIHGVCKAYEVTGDERYRRIAQAYWDSAVEKRGAFVTGGQTSGEVWTPPFKHAERLSNKNQEFCTVYNMMRLSEFLLRWTGEKRYADYWEKNLWNGVFAQTHFEPYYRYAQSEDSKRGTELLSYFLPLEAGAQKRWGSKFDHFWCCHGTMVQANTDMLRAGMFYSAEKTVAVMQYFQCCGEIETQYTRLEKPVFIEMKEDRTGATRPQAMQMNLHINGRQQHFTLMLRKPEWILGTPVITDRKGNPILFTERDGYLLLERVWEEETLQLAFPRGLRAYPLPDQPDTVAFMDGPVALAGLCDAQCELIGDKEQLETMFTADDEREWAVWDPNWRTIGQPVNIRFTPLYNIRHEKYTVYFPVRKKR